MGEKSDYLVMRLAEKGEEITGFLRGLSEEQWKTQVYSDEAEDGNWTAYDMVAHLISADLGMQRLYETIINGSEGAPEDFDLNRYNAGRLKKHEKVSSEKLIAQFETARTEIIEWVKTLDDETLAIKGRHANHSIGVQELEILIKVIYKHGTIHMNEIKTALGIGEGS